MSISSEMIRHGANTRVLSKTEKDTTVFVKGSTPFVSALKRIDKILEKFDKAPVNYKKFQHGDYKKVKFVLVKAMGSAMEKAVSIGLHYKEKSSYQIDFYTGTVKVVDEIKSGVKYETREGSEDEYELRGRDVSYIDVKIWLKRK